jgi:hypothetical protein
VGGVVPVGGVVVELEDTPKTVPVTCARVGLLVALRVTARHGSGPVVAMGVGVTTCQAPTPLFAAVLNHSKPVPPPRLQSLIVVEVKPLPAESATSKYSPDEVKEGVLTGSFPYWATVTPPTPVALAVVPALTAEAVPVGLVELPLCELVAALGAAGGVGTVTACGTLVSLKVATVKLPDVAVTV